MPDLLLELRSEEIPARMQRKAAGDLKKLLTDALVEAGLTYEGAREYWTPRRLTLDLRGLNTRSADVREDRKGPRTDANEKAIEGFRWPSRWAPTRWTSARPSTRIPRWARASAWRRKWRMAAARMCRLRASKSAAKLP